MKIGTAGDGLSLVRVLAAMVVCAAALAGIGYLFDLIVGPAISMSGWWTVFAAGGFILGGLLQATREFAVPQPFERRVLAAEARARRAAEAAEATEASDSADTTAGSPPSDA